jgi:uncharacterized membrane protein YhaH (DUF805 family)
MTLTQMLFAIEGRITRSQYWGCTIGKLVAFLAIIGVLAGITGGFDQESSVTLLAFILLVPIYIAWVWMAICVGAKRCHDRDRSGWFQLISLIPLIGGIWLLIELGFLDGTQGPNRFGPSPKGIAGTTVTSVFS